LRQITSADRGEPLKSRGEDWWVLSGNVKVVRYFRNQVSVVQTPKQLEVRLGKTPLQIRTAAHRTDPDEMNYRELWEYYHMMLRTPGTTQRQINELIVHLNNKIALPMACLAMCFLGPPMVLRRQRTSGSLGLGMSFLMIVGYFLVWNIMTLLGKMGTINPSLSSWIANVVSVIVGTALVYRASR
jgi:lipopolysaccharide export LptBFGC system permease protein LptF